MAPTQLGPYAIGRPLGKGGMGTVYAAVDSTTGESAAIKVLSAALSQQEGFRERFTAEIESLRLLRHPNIVRLLGFGEEGDCYFYAMELVEGRNLDEEMRAGRVFTPEEVINIGVQTCRALKHAHDSGVIHRDLKPANLMLSADGQVKLSDFGIARLFGNASITSEGGIIGTAEYMAPEQADGRPVTERCDLYSLGGVLYALLARRPPFVAKTVPEMLQLQRFASPEPVRRFAPSTPVELEEIVHQLLEKEPERRIPTALVLSRRLESLGQAMARSDVVLAKTTGNGDAAAAPVPSGAATIDMPTRDGAGGPPIAPERTFTAVVEEDDDGSRWQVVADTVSAWISPPTLILLAALALVGLAAWYAVQPQSADRVYERIKQLADDEKLDTSLRAESDIRSFLANYPDDPRGDELRGYLDQIELAQLERKFDLRARGLSLRRTPLAPVERTYVEAIAWLDIDPELCGRKLQALVDLYPEDESLPTTSRQCIHLAKRQLERLNRQFAQFAPAGAAALAQQVTRAESMQKTDAAAAARIWSAIVELYADKPWAQSTVTRARRELEKAEVAEREHAASP